MIRSYMDNLFETWLNYLIGPLSDERPVVTSRRLSASISCPAIRFTGVDIANVFT
jgi:hypothetical protein